VDDEIGHAQETAELLGKKTGSKNFSVTGDAVNVGGAHYPQTENWQKALGEHKIWGSGDIKVKGDQFSMRLTIHAKDRYDFNKGMSDIASGAADDENGRFATLGWARPFMVSGTLTRVVTWTRGNIAQSTSVTSVNNR
jgi:hypothetical protein